MKKTSAFFGFFGAMKIRDYDIDRRERSKAAIVIFYFYFFTPGRPLRDFKVAERVLNNYEVELFAMKLESSELIKGQGSKPKQFDLNVVFCIVLEL